MTEPADMILPLLREMRTGIEKRFDGIDGKLAEHDARFDRLERKVDDVNRGAVGESVLGRE